jgi:hypothetical protein
MESAVIVTSATALVAMETTDMLRVSRNTVIGTALVVISAAKTKETCEEDPPDLRVRGVLLFSFYAAPVAYQLVPSEIQEDEWTADAARVMAPAGPRTEPPAAATVTVNAAASLVTVN